MNIQPLLQELKRLRALNAALVSERNAAIASSEMHRSKREELAKEIRDYSKALFFCDGIDRIKSSVWDSTEYRRQAWLTRDPETNDVLIQRAALRRFRMGEV